MKKILTAIIEREGNGYVALCPEVDIASQGDTIEEARANLREALELFFETASQSDYRWANQDFFRPCEDLLGAFDDVERASFGELEPVSQRTIPLSILS